LAESSFEWSRAVLESKDALEEVTKDYRVIINCALEEVFEHHTQLAEAASKAILSGGKRIRPILTLLTCEATGGSCSKALHAALSFELAHAASLIQDDIIDDSIVRHNEPAVHAKYGSIRAMLVSDYLLFSIFSELSRYGRSNVSKAELVKVISLVANSAKMAAKGEFAEILLAAKGECTEEEYLDMVSLKTAALFAAPAAAGVAIAGGRPRLVEEAYRFGYYLGMGFQIVDDILDIVGNTGTTGKPIFKDVENHSSNYVVMRALSGSDHSMRLSIQRLLWRRKFTPQDSRKLISIFERSGALGDAIARAEEFCESSRRHLAVFPHAHAKERLEALTHALLSGLTSVRPRLDGASRAAAATKGGGGG
jgi:geranylgeranyl diphosphate synthase type I